MHSVRVVATGSVWIGKGIGSVATAIRELLSGAADEVQIASYTLGMAEDLLGLIENCLSRGVRVVMIVNKLKNQSTHSTSRLLDFKSRFQHFELVSFDPPETEDLHAKIIVVDRSRAIVGSANPSRRGLFRNHEIALVVSGEPAEQIADLIDALAGARFSTKVEM
jgi:phosphatidylserine/phosphatidylglycerophosphate/cardiolipin synthase-like enzyme